MQGNRVILVGYVGRDVSAKTTVKGIKRVTIRVATHFKVKNPQGEHAVNTVWHNVVAWDKVAGFAEKCFVKGSRILVEGFLEYSTFFDATGQVRHHTNVRAQRFMNLDR